MDTTDGKTEELFRGWMVDTTKAPLEEITSPTQQIKATREGDYLVIRCRLGAGMPGAFTSVSFGRCGELAFRADENEEFSKLGVIDSYREGGHLAVAVVLPKGSTVYTFVCKPRGAMASMQLRCTTELQSVVDGLSVYGLRAWPRLPKPTRVAVKVVSEKTSEDGVCIANLEMDNRLWTARRSAANVTLEVEETLSTGSAIYGWGTSQGGNHTAASLLIKPLLF